MKNGNAGKKKVFIVGSGAGGLSTAVHLAHQGWDVTVFEKEATAGGRLSAIEEKGYTIDIGPTILMMDDVFHQFFRDVDRKLEDYLELIRVDPLYRLVYHDGSVLEPCNDLKSNLDEIRRISPDDVDGYLAFLAQINKRYQVAREKFIEKPLHKLTHFMNFDTLWGMYQLKTLNHMYDDIARFVKDERLRIALTFQAIYLGLSPYQAPSIYTLIAYVEHALSGVWYPKGGMNAISKAMVKLLEEFGGKLLRKQEVTQILIENGRACGVRLASGEEMRADVVVSNVDFPTTMNKMVPEAYRGKYTPAKLARMHNTCSCFMMYLGTDKKFDCLHTHTIFFTKSYQETLHQIYEQNRMPDDPAIYVYAPTTVDDSVAPPGKHIVYVLVPVPNMTADVDWSKEVGPFRERVLDKLERCGLTDLRQHIEFERIYTPPIFEKKFNTYQGATFGLAPTLFQSAYFRPHIQSDQVSNLYFVGASTHPGGGVPVVIVSGRMVAQEIINEWGTASVNIAKGATALHQSTAH
ncbi:phytoene desaturase family protein [Heliophilum fasciatum]|uniref:Phytoene desaturase n=1 Tax=Heliophilum fasciatum TaxID=35700 RepID=A0A4V2SY30_9FIRM|nr:oleate hydratase [Heliophilum fasciatum]MCW2277058.1 phytoene desaturase [Heliophilum fasciatum]TCP68416.1 phytoene desaturase [Heliophilum fasciatum]